MIYYIVYAIYTFSGYHVYYLTDISANIIHWTNARLMLAHRLRRWTNITPALIQRAVLAGIA